MSSLPNGNGSLAVAGNSELAKMSTAKQQAKRRRGIVVSARDGDDREWEIANSELPIKTPAEM
jgi:hypothetical protein